jgi:hypothetical protein
MMTYRLTPINRNHESWKRSKVKKQIVRVVAHDCTDARWKTMQAALELEYRPPLGPHAPIVLQTSPWQLTDVTSCEPDASAPPPSDQVVSEDGTHWLADSDEVARAIRDDVARDYAMMSPGFGASLA